MGLGVHYFQTHPDEWIPFSEFPGFQVSNLTILRAEIHGAVAAECPVAADSPNKLEEFQMCQIDNDDNKNDN